MDGQDVARLVSLIAHECGKDEQVVKKDLSDKLDVNIKTFNSWTTEGKGKRDVKISRPMVAYLRRIVEPLLIRPRICTITSKLFALVPSECVAFWLVCGTEVILLKDSVRSQCVDQNKEYNQNDEIHKTLNDGSMTIDAIQNAQIVNTTKSFIKNYGDSNHLYVNYLTNSECHSVVKIPLIVGSKIGPRVVAVIELQNKLDNNGSGKQSVIKENSRSSDVGIFSSDDIDRIRTEALQGYNNTLKELMASLDYFDPLTSPQFQLGDDDEYVTDVYFKPPL